MNNDIELDIARMTNLTTLPAPNVCFDLTFPNGNTAKAVRATADSDPEQAMGLSGLTFPHPAIFISGGASLMSQEDQKLTERIIAEIGKFAEEYKAVIIDGGTESGVMNMIGEIRRSSGYHFPLVGVSPMGKVSYPGYKNPNEEAFLEDSHSHFLLIDGDNWGDESSMIVRLTHAMGGRGLKPTLGILINGGKIAMHEVYLASTKDLKLSMIVLEGSGRAADEISTAFRTGRTNQRILRAILEGGDIQLVATIEGEKGIRDKMAARFNR